MNLFGILFHGSPQPHNMFFHVVTLLQPLPPLLIKAFSITVGPFMMVLSGTKSASCDSSLFYTRIGREIC